MSTPLLPDVLWNLIQPMLPSLSVWARWVGNREQHFRNAAPILLSSWILDGWVGNPDIILGQKSGCGMCSRMLSQPKVLERRFWTLELIFCTPAAGGAMDCFRVAAQLSIVIR